MVGPSGKTGAAIAGGPHNPLTDHAYARIRAPRACDSWGGGWFSAK